MATLNADPTEILRAERVGVRLPGGRQILAPVSLDVAPGTFTALLGPSGSGKTTLLKALAGIAEPTEGAATLGNQPTWERAGELGYVPQRETVHDRLTVREALRYGALLRLEHDEDGIEEAVEDVLTELDLHGASETPIRDVSGGERRRAACGVELVGRPRVLLLDEPTSGLDPVLERRLMTTFRRLADQGRAVVIVTHATASLDLCDDVVVLAAGDVDFTGPPAAALQHLDGLARAAAAQEQTAHASGAGAKVRVGQTMHGLGFEIGVLVSRYARTFFRDRKTLAVLLGQAPVIGLLIAILFEPGALDRPDPRPGNAALITFLVMTGAIWLGITAAAREVVKERGILEREFDVGVRLDAYVIAKALVLFAFTTVQITLMVAVVVALQPPEEGLGNVLGLLGLTILTAWVSVAFGLVVSALARTVDQAAGVVPLLLVPQLLFAGGIVPLDRMPEGIYVLTNAMYGRWAFAGLGNTMGVPDRLDDAGAAGSALGYAGRSFDVTPGLSALALVIFLLALLILATLVLGRRAQADDGH